MVDTTRETVHPKLPVSLGMYKTSYKRDYQWCEEYKRPSKEDVQKLQIADAQLKAKEFAVPQEKQAMTYSDSVVGESREAIKASSHADNAGGRKPETSVFSPLEQREHSTSVPPLAESSLPKCHHATGLAATPVEKSEKLQALAELEHEQSSCRHLPAAAQTAGTAGMLLHGQKLVPGWATYQQFTMETCQARLHDAQKNRSMFLGSSVLMEECLDPDWRSTYNTDFQHCPGAHGGYCRPNKSISHIFPEDEHLKQNWISEYKDNYSIFLQRPKHSSQVPAAGLCPDLSFGNRTVTDTSQ